MILALKAACAVILVMLIECFVLSPRILGKMMELHPVLNITILPITCFFGVWGLILAIPVAVYVIHVLILQADCPAAGKHEPAAPQTTTHYRMKKREWTRQRNNRN